MNCKNKREGFDECTRPMSIKLLWHRVPEIAHPWSRKPIEVILDGPPDDFGTVKLCLYWSRNPTYTDKTRWTVYRVRAYSQDFCMRVPRRFETHHTREPEFEYFNWEQREAIAHWARSDYQLKRKMEEASGYGIVYDLIDLIRDNQIRRARNILDDHRQDRLLYRNVVIGLQHYMYQRTEFPFKVRLVLMSEKCYLKWLGMLHPGGICL